VIVLMVVTSVLGPVLTEIFGKRMVPANTPIRVQLAADAETIPHEVPPPID
jgi:hypothetical protein